jgi:GNAT superfamily N-acetyltransferase
MKIRVATKYDTPEICRMLRAYRSQTPWARLAQADNEPYIREILAHIFAGLGRIFIAERESQVTGMLIAVKNNNIWDPSLRVIDELAYWVDPEHRGSRAGYQLIRAYQLWAEELRSQGQIEAYTISKMSQGPDLNYQRLGFEKLEEKWRI